MNIEIKKITELNPYQNNPRKHTRNQIDMLKKSINEFGFIVPILVDENNIIITGHGRLKAAEKLGLTEVPTIQITHLDDEQIRAFRIADNYLTDESSWTKDLLKLEIGTINIPDFDFLKGLDLGMAATNIKLDHNVDEGDAGGAYFQTANEIFIQIGSISFSIEQSEETKTALGKLKKMQDKDKKAIGKSIIESINATK